MRTNALRDVAIFLAVVVIAGWVGVWLNEVTGATNPMESAGILLWLLAPPIAALIMALLAGSWAKRLGLGLGVAGSAKWYGLAVLATPVAVALVLIIGSPFGVFSYTGLPLATIGAIAVGVLLSSAIKNVFEEVCWRGFLSSWLEETRFDGLPNHLITGVIWAIWHVPYWLFFLSVSDIEAFSGLSLYGFIVVAFIALPLQAIFYGELRLASGSMWPAYVLHTVSNVVSLTLLSGGLVAVNGVLGAVLSPGTGGLLYSVLMAVAGIALYRQRVGSGQLLRGAV